MTLKTIAACTFLILSLQLTAQSAPRGIDRPAFAYDAARHKAVLFGGYADGIGHVDETWEWNGSRWTKRNTPGPSARFGHSMVYDSRRARIVMFGGADKNGLLNDTWEYDGILWRKVADSGPAPRESFGMAYDSVRARTVLYGGSQDQGQPTFADTWEWDGTVWRRVAEGGGPSGNSFHRMAYDARRNRLVAFGGRGGGNDLWERDSTSWTKPNTGGPSPRDHHSMTYDARRGQVVIFGGGGQPTGARGYTDENPWILDMWGWNGRVWRLLSATGPQVKKGMPAFTYDSDRDRLIVVGEGTWEWDGSRWIKRA